MRFTLILIFSLVASAATAQKLGPLTTISPQTYLTLTKDLQVAYVAGVLDGVTYTTYGYSIAGHDAYIQCARTMTMEVIARRVADWIRANPQFKEGAATAVATMLGELCSR
jgi:hypothetical protein